jgi:DNA-binding CsgD family transcriptional regulator
MSSSIALDPAQFSLNVYATILDGGCLSAAVEPLARAIGAASHAVHLMRFEGSRPTESRSIGGSTLPQAVMADYAAHWIRHDPWAQAAGRLGAGVHNFARTVSAEAMRRSAIWNEWAAPRDGAFHCMSALVQAGGGALGGIAFHRRRRDPPFDAAEEQILRDLYPHLSRAFLTHAQLQGEGAQQARALRAGFATLRQGVALLDRRRRLVLANPALDAMSAEGDGLALAVDDGLTASDPAARQAIARAVGTAMATLGGRVRVLPDASAVNVPRRSGGPPWLVQALPVRDLQAEPERPSFTGVMLLVTDTGRSARPGPTLLRQAFGLTQAEATLAAALAAGRTIADHAAQRRISVETARSHLAAIRRKTGCHRQSEITALLARMDRS